MIDFKDRTILVFGVASEDSIAWGICQILAKAGAKLILGYQPRYRSRLLQLQKSLPAIEGLYPIDVATEEGVQNFFREFSLHHSHCKAHALVHSIAFSPRETFDRSSLFATQEAIDLTLTISAHSLQRLLRLALPHLIPGSSTVTLTYLAAQRWVPAYRVMAIAKAALECWVRELASELGADGHRVNAISSGPMKTLASTGIPGIEKILAHVERNAPLRRNITQEEVAGAALWLLSDLASGVTGQIIYVDAGYSTIAVPASIREEP
jgi:enoyl-[acyl-carrier protein] reductase I